MSLKFNLATFGVVALVLVNISAKAHRGKIEANVPSAHRGNFEVDEPSGHHGNIEVTEPSGHGGRVEVTEQTGHGGNIEMTEPSGHRGNIELKEPPGRTIDDDENESIKDTSFQGTDGYPKGNGRDRRIKTYDDLVKENDDELQANITDSHPSPETPGWTNSDSLSNIKMDATGLPQLEETYHADPFKEELFGIDSHAASDKRFNQNNIIFEDDDGNIVNVHDERERRPHRKNINFDESDENLSAILSGYKDKLPSSTLGDINVR